jgi:hypothetical protein
MPTNECKAATSYGMLIISTLRAKINPIVPPTAKLMAKLAYYYWNSGKTKVAMIAEVMPTMPYILPLLAESCCESPPRARMNSREQNI